MKENNHPLWDILINHPSCFLEVKGEWSLSRLAHLIHNTSSKFDAKLATEKYRLVREYNSSEKLYTGNSTHQSDPKSKYSWETNNIQKDSQMCSIISDGIFSLIRKICFYKNCVYPPYSGYKYPKKKSVKSIRPSQVIIFVQISLQNHIQVNTFF
jgi:hypothetical protein